MKKNDPLIQTLLTLTLLCGALTAAMALVSSLIANDIALPTDGGVGLDAGTINGEITVVIDAGHGGEDGGTQSDDGTLEKDINLSISMKLENILNTEGFSTVMVRTDDRMIYDEDADTVRSRKSSDLHNRMKIMKQYSDCVFVSIHQNYYTESKYSGAQVFYRPNDESSRILADSIQKSIVSSLQKDNTRQIKQCTSSVYLIYNASSTAVMVECGFLSNNAEAEKLKNDDYQNSMAVAIADGIKYYLVNKEVNPDGKQN